MNGELPHVDVMVCDRQKHREQTIRKAVIHAGEQCVVVDNLGLGQFQLSWLDKRMSEPIGAERGMAEDIFPDKDSTDYLFHLHRWFRGGKSTGEHFSEPHLLRDCPFGDLRTTTISGCDYIDALEQVPEED